MRRINKRHSWTRGESMSDLEQLVTATSQLHQQLESAVRCLEV
jgi:hypothetical protein